MSESEVIFQGTLQAHAAIDAVMAAPRRYRMTIDTDLGVEYRDAGPWRSYHLVARGNTESELLANASIAEIDQEGDDLDCYGIEDAPVAVEEAAYDVIRRVVLKASNK